MYFEYTCQRFIFLTSGHKLKASFWCINMGYFSFVKPQSFDKKPGLKLPKIFHVNWFRKDASGKFMWPGFGDNLRVLDWILRRCDNECVATEGIAGLIPRPEDLKLDGLNPKPDIHSLLSLPPDFWKKEVEELKHYFNEQLPEDFPPQMQEELKQLELRASKAK